MLQKNKMGSSVNPENLICNDDSHTQTFATFAIIALPRYRLNGGTINKFLG